MKATIAPHIEAIGDRLIVERDSGGWNIVLLVQIEGKTEFASIRQSEFELTYFTLREVARMHRDNILTVLGTFPERPVIVQTSHGILKFCAADFDVSWKAAHVLHPRRAA